MGCVVGVQRTPSLEGGLRHANEGGNYSMSVRDLCSTMSSILRQISIKRKRSFSAKLLRALAWHSRSSGKISRNGNRLPVSGSVQALRLARCKIERNERETHKNEVSQPY